MMLAVVIIGILMVFTFSLLLVSYTLYASQSKKAASLRNAEAATSLSKALETELVENSTTGYIPETESALWKYLRCNIAQGDDDWPYYDPASAGHTEEYAFRYFDVKYGNNTMYGVQDGLEGYPANVKLCVYWMPPEGANATAYATGPVSNPANVRLFIEVICETASQSYVVKNEYRLKTDTYSDTDVQERNRMRAVLGLFTNGQSQYNPKGITTSETNPRKWKWEFVGRE